MFHRLNVPVFLYGGWYNLFQRGTIDDFIEIDHESGPAVRAGERLVEGSWGHGLYGPRIGEIYFGDKIIKDLAAEELRWLDHYVKGAAVFFNGHCIRLEISSSNFPTFPRNSNTGDEPEKDIRFVKAEQTIHHGASEPPMLTCPC